MKKLINDPRAVVREMLEGLVAQSPGCALLRDETVVIRTPLLDPPERTVAVISGGGSGHEPAHAGFVGHGLLTAAVAGEVFTSPSADSVLTALKAVAGPAGAVLIVKNYTGDRLNFGLAAELARGDGIPVEVVVVADDVALGSRVEKSRRRGIAGTILVHKIAGAAAAAGLPVEEVARLAREATRHLGSMGVALGACTLPAVGKPGFMLGDNEIEIGLGIHGEAGVERGRMQPVDALVETILETIIEDLDLKGGERVALLVNGLGATPPMELAIVAGSALSSLDRKGIHVERCWTGTFLSALDMPGFSLSILLVDEQRLALLDAPAEALAWPGGGSLNRDGTVDVVPARIELVVGDMSRSELEASRQLRRLALAAAGALIDAEATLTDLDTRAGDGDLGTNMARGAAAIQNLPDRAWRTPSVALAEMANAMRRTIGGSSGPFYATALLRASRRLADDPSPSAEVWVDAFRLGVEAISELGGAVPGDRTMIDALVPAARALSEALSAGHSTGAALAACVAAAEAGAESTRAMRPKLGRASYLGERAMGVPDGGATGVALWLKAVAAEIAAGDA